MSHRRLNLAAEPFINRRPVRRVALILWILAAVLLAIDGYLYWRNLSGQDEAREALRELDQELADEIRRLADLEAEASSLELAEQNRQVVFLNRKIARRTFSWSTLFDRLTEALPRDVRINRLTPRAPREQGAAARAMRAGGGRSEPVLLEISGEARDDGVILEFLDTLFAHRSFRDPDLLSESPTGEGTVAFALVVTYFPERVEQVPAAAGPREDPAVAGEQPPPAEPAEGQAGEAES